MKLNVMEYLACPRCQAELVCNPYQEDQGEIWAGTLHCAACNAVYPIQEGVPVLLPASLSGVERLTAQRFAYEWQTYAAITPAHEQQFLDWIAPVGPDFFRGKVILDAGCGKGRHLYYAAQYGAKAVIGLELGSAAQVAFRHTTRFPQAQVIQGDLLRPPLKQSFDYIYCIGVLHHLREPGLGVSALTGLLKPGGALSTWVYGREGNDWIIRTINPVRKHLTSRMPLLALRIGCVGLAALLFVVLRTFYHSQSQRPSMTRKRLFYQHYLSYIASFGLEEIQSIVFDHLLAPVAQYLRQEEVRKIYSQAGLKIRSQEWHNCNSWRTLGIKPSNSPGEMCETKTSSSDQS